MKSLYVQNSDPFAILMKELYVYRSSWLDGDQDIFSESSWPAGDRGLFDQFFKKFRMIGIYSGHPHNDYGQTVRLYSQGEFTEPDVENIPVAGNVPSHLVSENMPFKPSKMTGAYRYRRSEDKRVVDMPRIEEEFFFGYQSGYKPLCFADVQSSLSALRYLSAIMHKLDAFGVVLMEKGIYVSLVARINDSGKPMFFMGS